MVKSKSTVYKKTGKWNHQELIRYLRHCLRNVRLSSKVYNMARECVDLTKVFKIRNKKQRCCFNNGYCELNVALTQAKTHAVKHHHEKLIESRKTDSVLAHQYFPQFGTILSCPDSHLSGLGNPMPTGHTQLSIPFLLFLSREYGLTVECSLSQNLWFY